MIKIQSKNIINSFLAPILLVLGVFATSAHADINFGDGLTERIVPNCHLQKEYNYFMNQWTTNQVCDPNVVAVPQATSNLQIQNKNATGNIYLGSVPQNTTYNGYVNYPTYYTGNNSAPSYGSSANYLLSSFGGGTSQGYLLSSFGGGGYYTYPNSVYYYTPSVSSYYSDNYPSYYTYSDGGGSYSSSYSDGNGYYGSSYSSNDGSGDYSSPFTSDNSGDY